MLITYEYLTYLVIDILFMLYCIFGEKNAKKEEVTFRACTVILNRYN